MKRPVISPHRDVCRARTRARDWAVLVGCALLGASAAAHATPACRPGPALTLRVLSVSVAGEERPAPVDDAGLQLLEGGDLDTAYFGTVWDPDSEDSRLVELEPAP